jgi:hypothetical protein
LIFLLLLFLLLANHVEHSLFLCLDIIQSLVYLFLLFVPVDNILMLLNLYNLLRYLLRLVTKAQRLDLKIGQVGLWLAFIQRHLVERLSFFIRAMAVLVVILHLLVDYRLVGLTHESVDWRDHN